MKFWQKTIAAVATFALLVNSLSAPFVVLAEGETPTPEPTASPTTTPDATPTETPTPTSTPDATIEPSESPIVSPSASPTDLVTPTPTETPLATESASPTPTDQPVQDQNQDSSPTTPGPPSDSQPPASSEPSASPSVTPTATPAQPKEIGDLTTTVIEDVDLSQVKQLNSNVEGNSNIVTDKADYAPTDVVLITGTNFVPEKGYTLEISSSDEPPVTASDTVSANSEGTFSYAYQLDGNYRPNYKIEVKDGKFVVASTTFTDSDPASITYCHGTSLNNWKKNTTSGEAIVQEGHSGHNDDIIPSFSYTPSWCHDFWCQLFSDYSGKNLDHNFDGVTGQQILNNECVIPEQTLPACDGTIIYDKTDDFSKTDVVEIDFINTDSQGNPDSIKITAKGEYQILKVELTVQEDSQDDLYNYTSQILSGVTFNPSPGKTIERARVTLKRVCLPATGSITVTKDVDPNDASTWNFTVASVPAGFSGTTTLGDNGSHTFNNLAEGDYIISETGAAGTDSSQYIPTFSGDCEYKERTPSGYYIHIDGNESKNCKITNTKKAKIITKKVTVPSGDSQSFHFWSNYNTDPGFYLKDGQTNDSGWLDYHSSYYVSEETTTGWTTTSSCSNGNSPSQISLNPGDIVTCTFTNTKQMGSITIIKDANPNDPQDFSFSGTNGLGNFILDDDSDSYRSNTQTFSVAPGTYAINETPVSGWEQGDISCSGRGDLRDLETHTGGVSFYIGANAGVTCTFHNTKNGSISGYKWNDLDGDGREDSGESKLSGWRIFIESGQNDSYDPGERYDDTDGSGYSFNNLTPGTYRICEVEKTSEGWHNTSGGACRNVEVGAGQSVTNIKFGNQQLGSIKVCKVIVDAAGNITNGSAMPSSTFRINWSGGLDPTIINSGYTPNYQIFSNSTGPDAFCVDYKNIAIASYDYSREDISESGWETPKYNDQYETDILDLGDFYEYTNYGGNPDSNGNIDLRNDAGPIRTLVILNQYKVGSVTVTKFNDTNRNGYFDLDGEGTLDGWTVNLGQNSLTTGEEGQEEGKVLFTNIVAGQYNLSENLQGGYVQTNIYCDREAGRWLDDGSYRVNVTAGVNTNCYIGNFQEQPGVSISKTNDVSGSINAGATVNYSLTLTNTGNIPLNNIVISDILPGGFSYVPGSTTGATSNDPEKLGSVLSWAIDGVLNPEDSLTINYKATTSSDLSDGIYTNYATCRVGKSYDTYKAFMSEVETIDCDPAANSTVQIGSGRSYGGSMQGRVLGISQVLGASTELPATGSPTEIVIAALAMIGLGLMLNGVMRSRIKSLSKSKSQKKSRITAKKRGAKKNGKRK